MKKVSCGAKIVDDLVGGLETDAITTIYGPAGAGKTNFALLAAVEIAKSGKKVIFVDTEGGFSVDRLKQIMPDYKRLFDRIMFLNPTTFEEQKQTIEKLKELVNTKIGLIVVDTMTMLYRLERSFKDEEYNRDLGVQMLQLNEIARKHNIPVLLTSQVYSSFDSNKVKIVGGDILTYASKCLLEVEQLHNGRRKLTLHKHRSVPSGQQVLFEIYDKGVKKVEKT
ncbi:DNA repair and recombination protein RadB [Candidatus Woesearchaeota archaeon CG10_big_fil_rev_8_21_14_0_10_37_12]|nr:MAG: DNA repair and recombination protein RadB [Candidatus Woesearchaeota archaeon CG10_big_fil_rev_8_21_14_0_10_37_12]